MNEVYNAVDQPLYSREIIKSDKSECWFFGKTCAGGIYVDTNLCYENSLAKHQTFKIECIDFHFTYASELVRRFLIKHAFFIVRIVDMDCLIFPFHLMERYGTFFRKKLSIPITINGCESFAVIIRTAIPYKKDIQLTCELNGVLRRPGL